MRDVVGIIAMVLASLALIMLFVARARADEAHQHPPEDAWLHEKFYSKWMMPGVRDVSCCNDKDCYPALVKKFGATWFAKRREDGVWVPLPDNKLEHNQSDPVGSPDGRSHVCMAPPEAGMNVFCATLGSGQ